MIKSAKQNIFKMNTLNIYSNLWISKSAKQKICLCKL